MQFLMLDHEDFLPRLLRFLKLEVVDFFDARIAADVYIFRKSYFVSFQILLFERLMLNCDLVQSLWTLLLCK